MRQQVSMLFVTLLLAGSTFGTTARGDEEKIDFKDLPKGTIDSVKKFFPTADVLGASKEMEDKKIVYEVQLKLKDAHIDVTVNEKGQVELIEKEIPSKDLPKAVAGALSAKYPNAKIDLAEEVSKVEDGKAKLEYYELKIETAGKKKLEIELLPGGKIKHEEEKGDKEENEQKK